MKLRYKTRRRLALLLLLVWLPLYVVVAATVVPMFGRPSIWIELLIYMVLGLLWAWPFRAVFRGIGKFDPDKSDQ